jgi:hypothetical protein
MAEHPRTGFGGGSGARFRGRIGRGLVRPLGEGASFGRYGISFAALVAVVGGETIRRNYTLSTWLAAIVAFALAIVAAREKQKSRARVSAGAAIVLAALSAASGSRWFAGVAAVGIWLCTEAGLVALAEIDSPACVASTRALPWRAWHVALVLSSALGFYLGAHPGTPAIGVVGVTVVGIPALIFAAIRVGQERRLELGIPEKIRVILVLTITLTGFTFLWSIVDRFAVADICTIGFAITAFAIVRIATAADAVVVAQKSRIVVSLMFAGSPFMLTAFIAADDGHSPLLAVGCVVAALAIGAGAKSLSASLRPAAGEFLDAAENARSAMKQDGSDEALAAALVALREPVKAVNGYAEILLLDPPRAISVDAAGYVRSRDEVVPTHLIDVASREPEAVLRADALDELQVRRPDLRSLARWMDEHRALAATVVSNAGEPIAVLVIPRGNRKDLFSLEEARALKKLADDFTGLCLARAAVARGLARQVEASAAVDAAIQKQEQLELLLAVEGERHRLATTRLARPAAIGVYSAAARFALEALEKKTQSSAPIVVLAPAGVDPVPLVARAHLSGARAGEPFVVVDGTSTRDHDLEKWRDKKTSPLVLADRGLLLLIDGAALPRDVQQMIGVALAERRSPSGGATSLDVQIAITTAREESLAQDSNEIDALLASRFGAALSSPIRLPRLDERPEDLRMLVTDLMAREGIRARGDAVGIDDKAFMQLVEYSFPGGDAELVAIVRRLVAMAKNDNVVREAHVAALKLDFSAGEVAEADRKIRLV